MQRGSQPCRGPGAPARSLLSPDPSPNTAPTPSRDEASGCSSNQTLRLVLPPNWPKSLKCPKPHGTKQEPSGPPRLQEPRAPANVGGRRGRTPAEAPSRARCFPGTRAEHARWSVPCPWLAGPSRPVGTRSFPRMARCWQARPLCPSVQSFDCLTLVILQETRVIKT